MSITEDAPFSRPLPLRAGTVDHGRFSVLASTAEMAAVAALVDARTVEDFEIEGELSRSDGMYRLEGVVRAVVEQVCVVTEDPVRSTIVAPFDRWVVVGDAPDDGDVEVLFDERDVDYVATPEIDLGAVAVEELALALPAYPRATVADAALDDVRETVEAEDGPFAVLARRRGAS